MVSSGLTLYSHFPLYPTACGAFTVEELHALVFRLDVAETVESLDEVAERIRDEMVAEIERRDE